MFFFLLKRKLDILFLSLSLAYLKYYILLSYRIQKKIDYFEITRVPVDECYGTNNFSFLFSLSYYI